MNNSWASISQSASNKIYGIFNMERDLKDLPYTYLNGYNSFPAYIENLILVNNGLKEIMQFM